MAIALFVNNFLFLFSVRWQFDLYKHYATKHYYEDILAIMAIPSQSPYRYKRIILVIKYCYCHTVIFYLTYFHSDQKAPSAGRRYPKENCLFVLLWPSPSSLHLCPRLLRRSPKRKFIDY